MMTQREYQPESENPPSVRRRRRISKDEGEPARLSLTSLMDIVTNILVYIIKIFVVSPILIQDPSVTLPSSFSQEEIQDAMVVMITGMTRQESEDNTMEHVAEVPTIVVDDKVVAEIDPKSYRVPSKLKERGYIITPLKEELLEIRRKQGKTGELTEQEGFTGNVVIVADKNTPYRVLADVLVTCGEAGFGDFKFAIVKHES